MHVRARRCRGAGQEEAQHKRVRVGHMRSARDHPDATEISHNICRAQQIHDRRKQASCTAELEGHKPFNYNHS